MNITLENITMIFSDGNLVLNNISFRSEAQALALIGPSGGGKSTMLRILGGLLKPTAGSVYIDGIKQPDNEREMVDYRRRLGFVFQQNGLFRHLDAVTNIALPLKAVYGISPAEAKDTAMGLLERFGLADSAHKRPGELSGGQQQRVAIARAIAPRPGLLLLDEPTSALDPEYTAEVLDMVAELRSSGQNLVIVTHEMGFARKACDQVAFLSGGKVMEAGASEDIFERPETPELQRFLKKLLGWNL